MTHVSEFSGPDPTRVIGRRIVAAFIDSMLGLIVLGAALLAMGTSFAEVSGVAGTGAGGLGALEAGQLAVGLVFSLLFAVLNRIIFVAVYGWTLGKLFVGLRCVNTLGRPPGVARATTRGLVMYLFESILGVLGSLILLLSILATKGHRSIADLAARTFVIDSSYEGRLIVLGDRGAVAGPTSVTREEAAQFGYDVGGDGGQGSPVTTSTAVAAAPPETPPPPAGVRGTPSFDPSLGTFVVFDAATGQWLKQRRTSGEWVAMDSF